MNSSLVGKRWLRIVAGGSLTIIIASTAFLVLLNPALTRYVEGAAFRAELEKQTAKGLHFPSSRYAPIRRIGFLTAASDRFEAANGRKAMTKLDARDLTARFNPFGIFLRRWQIDDLHIGGGEVGIQTYEPKPEPLPSKPWFHVFLPNRVYLKRIWSDPADVTWRLRDEPAGFFGTRLLITPHGRDFEYRATGGTMKMALIPDLQLRETHLLITKTVLSIYKLDLASGEGSIHAEGTAGTRDDKSVDFTMAFDGLPLREWLPANLRGHITGAAEGNVRWRGSNPKLEQASVQGLLRVRGGQLRDLKWLDEIAAIAKNKSLAELELDECAAELLWENGSADLKKIEIEAKGKFRIEGALSLRHDELGGALQFGLAPTYLEWLPHAEEIFTRDREGYLWTTVHLSGTLDAPQQDLSPRLLAALKETPSAFLGAMFRALGEWLKGAGKSP